MSSNFLMDNNCFACGKENPFGLKLKIERNPDEVLSTIKLTKEYQGYKDVAHGGIIATILDEMAVWSAYNSGFKSVTGEINVRIRKPMMVENEYRARGWIKKIKHRLILAGAEIREKKNNAVIALADIKLIKID